MVKKILGYIRLILSMSFMVAAIIGSVMACCWSHDKFNYPELIAVVCYFLSILIFYWGMLW